MLTNLVAALATMVFFGPTGLTVAAFALLLTGAGDPVTVPARLAAAAGLAVYATAVAAVCVPFLAVARAGARSASTLLLAGASGWLLAGWSQMSP